MSTIELHVKCHIYFLSLGLKILYQLLFVWNFSGLNLHLSLPALSPVLIILAVLHWELVRQVGVTARCCYSVTGLDEQSLLTLSEETAFLFEQ